MAELPSADQFNAPTVTEAQFKEAQAKLIDYVAEIGNKTVAIQYGFQSLEDFEADKTKIPAGSSVVVAGELYIWDGGALTKSAYDPVEQSISFTESKLSEKQNLTNLLNDFVAKSIEYNAKNTKSAALVCDEDVLRKQLTLIQNASSFTITNKSSVQRLRLSNNTDTAIKSFKVLDSELNEVIDYTLLPNDSLRDDVLTTAWGEIDSSAYKSISRFTDSNGFRIYFSYGNTYPYSFAADYLRCCDKSQLIASDTETNLTTSNILSVSTRAISSTEVGIQIKVPSSYLIENGLSDNIDSARDFAVALFPLLDLHGRRSAFQTESSAFKSVKLKPGAYTVLYDASTVMWSFDAASNLFRVDNTKAGNFEIFTTSVKNTSKQELLNSITELKVNFPEGLCFSSDQIEVKDNNGILYDVQYASTRSANARYQTDSSFHFGGSFKTGSLFLIANFAVDEEKYFTIKVYDTAIKKSVNTLIETKNATYTRYENYGYFVEFANKKSQPYYLKAVGTSTVSFPVQAGTQYNVVRSTDETLSTNVLALTREDDYVKVKQGLVFTEFLLTVFNNTTESLNISDSLTTTVVMRLFKNGEIRFQAYTSAQKDIPVKTLTGVLQQFLSSTTWQSTAKSSNYSHNRVTLSNVNLDIMTKYTYGDTHRDGVNYGAERPAFYIETLGTSTLDLRYGWIASPTSTTATTWNVPQNWTWYYEGVMLINNTKSASVTADIQANQPVGILGKTGNFFVKKSKLKADLANYIIDMKNFFHSDLALNPTQVNQYRLRNAELIDLIINDAGDFESIYAGFISYLNSISGNDISTLGSKWLAGQNPLQFTSRTVSPHLQYLYLYAVKVGDAAKQDELKIAAKSLADAIVTRYKANGGVPLLGNLSGGVGNSNSNASAMRFLAIAIKMDIDTTGEYQTTWTALQNLICLKTGFMRLQNMFFDNYALTFYSQERYLHYHLYTINQYVQSCYLLNVSPLLNIEQVTLNAMNADGCFREVEWCISESRRGSRNTYGFALSSLLERSDTCMNAASVILQNIKANDVNNLGTPSRVYDHQSVNASGENIIDNSNIYFTTTALCDVYFAMYFNLIT